MHSRRHWPTKHAMHPGRLLACTSASILRACSSRPAAACSLPSWLAVFIWSRFQALTVFVLAAAMSGMPSSASMSTSMAAGEGAVGMRSQPALAWWRAAPVAASTTAVPAPTRPPAMPFSATRNDCSSSSSALPSSSSLLSASTPPLLLRARLAGRGLAGSSSSSCATASSCLAWLLGSPAPPLAWLTPPASSALASSRMASVLRCAHSDRSASYTGEQQGWAGDR